MVGRWDQVPLEKLLAQTTDTVVIQDDLVYKQVTARLHNKGLVLRQQIAGREIRTKKQFRIRTGQFVYSRIDARNGAMGLVPPNLDGAIVTNDFPVFDVHPGLLDARFLHYYTSTATFLEQCLAASAGTTNRRRLKERNFLSISIPLPPLEEQRRIVARIEALAGRGDEIKQQQERVQNHLQGLLLSAYERIIQDAPRLPMAEAAPLVRRRVQVEPAGTYLELGIRSFGKGAFHKPPVSGSDLGNKRVFRIEPGDLLFNIVFAWEGAVAVAKPEDRGRVGSHRFLTCVPKPGIVTAPFLCFHFQAGRGLQQLGEASPGAAGRNRTLGLKALGKILVPIPPLEKQLWFNALKSKADSIRELQTLSAAEIDALQTSLLDRAFRGEL